MELQTIDSDDLASVTGGLGPILGSIFSALGGLGQRLGAGQRAAPQSAGEQGAASACAAPRAKPGG